MVRIHVLSHQRGLDAFKHMPDVARVCGAGEVRVCVWPLLDKLAQKELLHVLEVPGVAWCVCDTCEISSSNMMKTSASRFLYIHDSTKLKIDISLQK